MAEKESGSGQAIVPAGGDWRTRTFVFGGIVGAVLGLLSAYLYVRSAEEEHAGQAPASPKAGDALRLGTSVLAIVRTITEWGKR
jgi:hypothetical protein